MLHEIFEKLLSGLLMYQLFEKKKLKTTLLNRLFIDHLNYRPIEKYFLPNIYLML